mmetsp:Transcript_82756/g.267840  ORF Transcript_82756/g.267840 Transcript_82756/m.267840 type:complete len:237 (+) Transcript_82756:251-961(+)
MQSPMAFRQDWGSLAAFGQAAITGMQVTRQPLRKSSPPATFFARSTAHLAQVSGTANFVWAHLPSWSYLTLKPFMTFSHSGGVLRKKDLSVMAFSMLARSSSVQRMRSFLLFATGAVRFAAASTLTFRRLRAEMPATSRLPSWALGKWTLYVFTYCPGPVTAQGSQEPASWPLPTRTSACSPAWKLSRPSSAACSCSAASADPCPTSVESATSSGPCLFCRAWSALSVGMTLWMSL